MRNGLSWVAVVAALAPTFVFADSGADDNKGGRSTPIIRKFRFAYAGTINKLSPGTKARVWLPVAQDNHEQQVTLESVSLPAKHEQSQETKFGNRVLFFEAVANGAGEIPFDVRYVVNRTELRASSAELVALKELNNYLSATTFEPADGSLTLKIFGDKKPMGQAEHVARQLYDVINGRMKYDKPDGQPWGRGDARWACDSRFGNCTDFHSLFISLCRDQRIPAKFEMGFSIPTAKSNGKVAEIAGYHCWAKFASEGKWIPVDISEANKDANLTEYYFGNLTADRVSFTTGRDLVLSPAPESGPVSFLVYPYVEVAGKPHASFAKKFGYEDLK